MKQRRSFSRWLVGAAFLGLIVIAVWYHQFIFDVSRSLVYRPSSAVSQLVDDLELTFLGRTYFYASTPVFDNSSAASDQCGTTEQSTAVLGCYSGGVIYVYDIDNSELQGVEQVTAAHEILHAAYARLSSSEKTTIQQLVRAEEEQLKSDQEFTDRMAAYKELNEVSYYDELYAVIGTEFTDISDELEAHYARYLNNRQVIINYHDSYKKVFLDLQSKADALVKQYNDTVMKRNELVEQMNDEYAKIEQQVKEVEAVANPSAEQVAEVNRQVAAYNKKLETARQQLKDYDKTLETLKSDIAATAVHQQTLNKTIDSSLAPSPQL